MASTPDMDKALREASENGNLPMVEHLVKKGADMEAKGAYDNTPLHHASVNGHLPVVEFLVENGADMEAKEKVRHTDSLFREAQ